MSVSLTISKWIDSDRNNREFIVDIPVSFQSVWNQVWEPAITACDVQFFKCCNVFTTEQIPKVLEELARIYDWVQVNDVEDTAYITERIRDELKPFLTEFYQEHKGENYRFSVG